MFSQIFDRFWLFSVLLFGALFLGMITQSLAQSNNNAPKNNEPKNNAPKKTIIKTKQTGNGAPVAKLTGPDSRPPGSLVIISATGTQGVNFAFDCVPHNAEWKAVKFFDPTGKEDFGIIFSTNKQGTYYFFLAASSKNGGIAVATHQVIIGKPGPGPDPGPDPDPDPDPVPIITDLAKKIDSVYKVDLASGVGTKQQFQDLTNLYANIAKITVMDPNLKKASEVWEVARQASAQKLPPGSLPQTRKLLADYQTTTLFPNFTVETVLTATTRQEMQAGFNKMAAAMSEVQKINP